VTDVNEAPRRILVILDDCGPGDALRVSFAVRALRDRYPRGEIVLLAAQSAREVALRLPGVDRVVLSRLYEHRSDSLFRLRLKKLRDLLTLPFRIGRGYDLALVLLCGTTLLDLIAFFAARERVGFSNRLPRLLSSRLGAYSLTGSPTAIEQHLLLLETAGVGKPADVGPTSIDTIEDTELLSGLLAKHGLDRGASLVVFHPGSDWACQQWTPERWAALADRIAFRHGGGLVFTGVAGEQEYIAEIQARMKTRSVSLAGATSLGVLSALLRCARLCVCVDSAVHELCQSVGTRSVVLAGPHGLPSRPEDDSTAIFVDRATPEMREMILACKAGKYTHGGCLDFRCPMAGLREVGVGDVAAAIQLTGFELVEEGGFARDLAPDIGVSPGSAVPA
jgi:ADP-heptose:LPS heptosyltransferase